MKIFCAKQSLIFVLLRLLRLLQHTTVALVVAAVLARQLELEGQEVGTGDRHGVARATAEMQVHQQLVVPEELSQ
jgi:hypothetical protein